MLQPCLWLVEFPLKEMIVGERRIAMRGGDCGEGAAHGWLPVN